MHHSQRLLSVDISNRGDKNEVREPGMIRIRGRLNISSISMDWIVHCHVCYL